MTFRQSPSANFWQRLLRFCAALLVVKVTISIVLNYGDYFPPDFHQGFLRGREAHFYGGYEAAFYAHILSGPLALLLGLLLVTDAFRLRYPRWHRRLGRCQVLAVLLVVAPSGLIMAFYAEAGTWAAASFAALALAIALCVAMGWRRAVKRQFAAHRRWMWRSFLLLASAVVLRLLGGLATVTAFTPPWIDPTIAWTSWLLPLAAYELTQTPEKYRTSNA